jgi:hypothetical protein
MEFNDWLNQVKKERHEISEFVDRIAPLISSTGFNVAEFERKVTAGLRRIDQEIDNSLKPSQNAEN